MIHGVIGDIIGEDEFYKPVGDRGTLSICCGARLGEVGSGLARQVVCSACKRASSEMPKRQEVQS